MEGYLQFNMLYTLVEKEHFWPANIESELMLLWQMAVSKGNPTIPHLSKLTTTKRFSLLTIWRVSRPLYSANHLYMTSTTMKLSIATILFHKIEIKTTQHLQ
jgi:hypothetical protein